VAAIDRSAVTGLILAGGRATRLGGVDKGWAAYRGQPLIERVSARLTSQVSALLISANRNRERYAALGWPVVADADEIFAGPLAGMLAGLSAARTPYVAVVPCDAPDLPADLIERLGAGIGDDPAAIAMAAGRWQPTFCLLHTELKGSLAAAMVNGERSAGAWLASIGAVPVEFVNAQAFANLNTTEDFAAAQA
jgi:molybdopterin-guanine dinucleotide biosynthesis protein A